MSAMLIEIFNSPTKIRFLKIQNLKNNHLFRLTYLIEKTVRVMSQC